MYRNVADFCTLILHPVTLLNFSVSSNWFRASVCVDASGFPTYGIIGPVNGDHLTSFILIRMFYISFSRRIAVDRIFNTLLSRSSESRHPCLGPGLWRPCVMLATDFFNMAFIMVRKRPLMVLGQTEPGQLDTHMPRMNFDPDLAGCVFSSWKRVKFCQMLFLRQLSGSFILLMWYNSLIDFHILNHPHIPGINPTLS